MPAPPAPPRPPRDRTGQVVTLGLVVMAVVGVVTIFGGSILAFLNLELGGPEPAASRATTAAPR